MAERTAQKQQATSSRRAAILRVAARIIMQKGFEQTTVAEIAREAEVGVGTIYLFFESKEALHWALLEEKAGELLAHVERPGQAPLTGAEGVRKLTSRDLIDDGEYLPQVDGRPADRRQREFEEKRQAILAATAEVFLAKGLHATSMADIAAQAGVAKGTLYNFFASKEELYFSLIEEKLHEFFLYMQVEVAQVASAAAKVERLIHAECHFIESNQAFFRIYVSTRSGFEWDALADLGERVHARYAVYLDWVAGLMQAGIEAGELAPGDPKEMAQALIGMLNGFLFAWTIERSIPEAGGATGDDRALSLSAKAPRMAELFLQGASRR